MLQYKKLTEPITHSTIERYSEFLIYKRRYKGSHKLTAVIASKINTSRKHHRRARKRLTKWQFMKKSLKKYKR